MIRRILPAAVVATLIGFSAITGMSAPAAQAATASSCGVVIDDANVLGSNADKVQQTAQSLNSAVNADVRVVTEPSLNGSATLDDLITKIQNQCSAWQSPNGQRKSNLLVFAMTKNDRKLGIFYGDTWVNAFTGSNSETRIYNDFMVPQFKNGDFAQGFINAMNESKRVLNNYLHPSTSTGGNASGKSSGGNGGLIAGIVIGGIVLLIALGVLIWYITSRRAKKRKADEDRKVMQQRALSARDRASQILDEVGDTARAAVRKAKVAKYSGVNNDIRDQLANAYQTVEQNFTNATNGKLAAASASANEEDKDLTTGEYEQLAVRYEKVLEQAEAAQTADAEIDTICTDVEKDLQRAGSMISDSETRLTALNSQLSDLTAQGIKVDTITASISSAQATLDSAKQHANDLAVLTDLDNVDAKLNDAEHSLQTLNKQRTDLAAGLPQLEGRIEQVNGLIPQTKACFDRISGEYAESCWESVRGNGTEALARIEAAREALAQATSLSGLDHQDWQQAVALMQQGDQLLDEAESLQTSITELEANLAHAKETAQQEIEDATADIAKADAYLRQYGNDVKDSHQNDLQVANETLTRAKTELSKSKPNKPDYLKVVKLALAANHSADDVLSECTSEHEAADRLRRQAASMLQQANTSVSRAREYISDHHSDIHSGAKSALQDAERLLTSAQSRRDAQNQLQEAKQADSSAEEAYRKAKRDHDDAEDERRRRSYNSGSEYGGFGTGLGVGYGIGSSHHHSSGGFSSGSFGGGFGGGSSGSFGSSGGGGGSSGGW